MEILSTVLEYIKKYNIEIISLGNIKIDIIMAIISLLFLAFIINMFRYFSKNSKQKAYQGNVIGTFVSSTMYDEKIKKDIKEGLVRYVINDTPIIKRLKIPQKYRTMESLNIKYDINNQENAIVDTDKTSLINAIKFLILSIICIGILICLGI